MMQFKHSIEWILLNLNLSYAMTLFANPEPLEELRDKGRLEDWWEDELNEQEMMPTYHIEFPNLPIQIYVHETVDMFDKYEDGEERDEEDNIEGDDYYFQNIYEIQIYDLKGGFIDGKATFSLEDIENLIKKVV
jgi:hypothetical protein